jgi:hypothetical protein
MTIVTHKLKAYDVDGEGFLRVPGTGTRTSRR